MYNFKYKKYNDLFWKTKKVIGHGVDFIEEAIVDANSKRVLQIIKKPLDAMILYFEDGSIERIAEWSKYSMKLGTDWKLHLKNQMEKEIGQDIKLQR